MLNFEVLRQRNVESTKLRKLLFSPLHQIWLVASLFLLRSGARDLPHQQQHQHSSLGTLASWLRQLSLGTLAKASATSNPGLQRN